MGTLKEWLDSIDWEQRLKDRYAEEIANLNNYSYWYPKVKDCGIKMVDSKVYKIPFDMWREFRNIENKTSQDICIKFLKELLNNDSELNKHKRYNIKNGAFSNKFDASDCNVHFNDIPNKFLNIQYMSQCYDTGGSTELVIRDYIPYDRQTIPTIYNGLPLRTEFRVFVDFDKNEVLYIVNYWDYDYCYDKLDLTDRIIFDYMKEILKNEYESNKEKVISDRIAELETERLNLIEKAKKSLLCGGLNPDIDFSELGIDLEQIWIRKNELEKLKKGLGLVPVEKIESVKTTEEEVST